jgi:hypothetical protein
LEEFLLLSSLSLVLVLMHRGRLVLDDWRLRWRLRLLCLGLGLLGLGRTLLAGFVLAAAPATPMPLRLPRTIGRGRPQISLGLG